MPQSVASPAYAKAACMRTTSAVSLPRRCQHRCADRDRSWHSPPLRTPTARWISSSPAIHGCVVASAGLPRHRPASGALRQEFVPSNVGTGLQAVDVCLKLTYGHHRETRHVRAGTAAAPGLSSPRRHQRPGPRAPLESTSNSRHFRSPYDRHDLPAGTQRLPAFSWRGTCGVIAGACTTLDRDRYPPGVSNAIAWRH